MKLKDNSNNIIMYNNRNKRLYFLTKNLNHPRNNLNKINLNKKIEFILDNMKKEDSKQMRFSNLIKSLDLNTNTVLSIQENPQQHDKDLQNQTQNPEYSDLSQHVLSDRKEIEHLFEIYGFKYQTYFENPFYNTEYKYTENNLLPQLKEKHPEEEIKEKVKKNIQKEISNLQDLLDLIEENPLDDNIEYNINMKGLHNIKEPLQDLSKMIGMKDLKESVVDQILYFIQDFHTKGEKDFMHTVIYGPPGTGKTEIAKIMGKLFSKLGVLKKNKFKKVTRTDLVAGYLGQTAIKTNEVIKDALDGVLFIDEAYALGNPEKRDSFAKECIDTLCEALSDNKHRLMVIIAGYEHELKQCFFNYNQGLDSRFTWRFKTDDYNSEELKQIFRKKVVDSKWDITDEIKTSWFEKNKDYFSFYGRDMETLFAKIKIAHSRRVFCLDNDAKGKITLEDMDKGLSFFLQNDEVKKRKKSTDNTYMTTMYN
jgi:SpoVK/Ycf46/Vps4 family AAA+-type ATPase